MTTHFLLGIFNAIYVLALAVWVGSMVFFLFAVMPRIARNPNAEGAGQLSRALLPSFYLGGAIAAAAALPAFVAVPLSFPEYRGPAIGVQALLIMGCALAMLYAGNSLTPAILAARAEGSPGEVRLARLHSRLYGLNIVVLVIGAGLLIAFAVRPGPRTSGIRELSPVERAQFDASLDQVIERVEEKYGFRRSRGPSGNAPEAPGPGVTPEMIQELDSYYAAKRARDAARRGEGTNTRP